MFTNIIFIRNIIDKLFWKKIAKKWNFYLHKNARLRVFYSSFNGFLGLRNFTAFTHLRLFVELGITNMPSYLDIWDHIKPCDRFFWGPHGQKYSWTTFRVTRGFLQHIQPRIRSMKSLSLIVRKPTCSTER